jgi:hypothetical protein
MPRDWLRLQGCQADGNELSIDRMLVFVFESYKPCEEKKVLGYVGLNDKEE